MTIIRHGFPLLVVLGCALCLGQTSSENASASERIVSVPVTLADRAGNPITGLKMSDFILFVGGRKEQIESAIEVAPVAVGKNKTRVAFVVLDSLGSPLSVQDEARQECLRLLADSVGRNTAVSLLEIDVNGLQAVHQVGTPDPVLVSALLQLDKEKHFLRNRDPLQKMQTAGPDDPALTPELNRLRAFRKGTAAQTNMMSTFLTQLKAWQTLANAVKGVPGRKTVVWLTANFPVEINPYEDSININSYGITSTFPVASASIDYQQTIDLVNAAQISIFPVQFEAVVDSERTATGLRQLARSTGGELLNFSHDLETVLGRAESRTGMYYILNFHPIFNKANIKWAGIKVKVTNQSAEVLSPSGRFLWTSQH
jgi:VWFA-related protein